MIVAIEERGELGVRGEERPCPGETESGGKLRETVPGTDINNPFRRRHSHVHC